MKFRIKHVEGVGYFPQVKTFLFWYRIGVHDGGFGLYKTYCCPRESEKEAQDVIDRYAKWHKKEANKVTYIDYQPQ